jgi:hypothetical protein
MQHTTFTDDVTYIKGLIGVLECKVTARSQYVKDTLYGPGFADADLTFIEESARYIAARARALRDAVERERDEIKNAPPNVQRERESA